MPNHGDKFYEEVTTDNAVTKMFQRLEKEHGSKIKRYVRQAEHQGSFYFTLILENYELLEVTLNPTGGYFMGKPSIEVQVEVY
jgi:hypothetical protein